MATSSVRDLRNHFPRIRKLVEAEGEVLLTERGVPKYRLLPYSASPPEAPPPVNYWTRLNSYQPVALSESEAQTLHDENRGER
jgi:antitoxin (DNA-binding transcriptional repressor) of toxin-antitoxin stability system